MHLKSLTLKGFKSFPDRTRLEFSPGISVVVGPNGSGKSNVTDAVLWALGEQSPLAVRGQSMQDVIFAGAHGVQARDQAEVELVICNAGGAVDLPLSEISILRRLDRAGEGEYRLNGSRCRLVDVLELLSDTGLGKEMHSVVSQGRIESIVTSKPRDRRMLIEEAAGLGKHRKRRRRAQLRLDRTQENLDRALDVEREARSRLRPLKRQAEAAALHERLERQATEARWALAAEAVRAAGVELLSSAEAVRVVRAERARAQEQLEQVAARRAAAEQALAARGERRERIASAFYAARSAAEKVSARLDAAQAIAADAKARLPRREQRISSLEASLAGGDEPGGGAARVSALQAALAELDEQAAARLEAELVDLLSAQDAAAAAATAARAVADERAAALAAADTAAEASRAARRDAERMADAARRESSRIGSELAQLNQALRRHAPAPGGGRALAEALDAEPGCELALAAALDGRLTAALASTREEAATLLNRAGSDGGTVLVAGSPAPPAADAPPGATALLAAVRTTDPQARAVAAALLADVWLVDDLAALPGGFAGVAVTRSGRIWRAGIGELRQAVAGGEDRVLELRNRRAELIAVAETAARTEQDAKSAVERAIAAFEAAAAARDEADRVARGAARERQAAEDAQRAAERRVSQRRQAPDGGPGAVERARIEAELAAERRLAERLARERAEREQQLAAERAGLAADAALIPQAQVLAAALAEAAEAVAARVAAIGELRAADRSEDERLSAELRGCAAQESEVQRALARQGEAVTAAEVAAQRTRDHAHEAQAELTRLSERLGLDAEADSDPLSDEQAATLRRRIEKLERRRQQLGPVNPLAQQELEEALGHVEELERQREDLETALRELSQLIRDTDKRIRESFEETFAAAAAAFEEVAAHLFPGGRGRLRLVREDAGPRPVLGGAEPPSTNGAGPHAEAAAEAEAEAGMRAREGEAGPEEAMGVEIEITPAGKATKRLSLLSGGEKSLTALAFLFAVFLARPCPFYILDEVEAALDDLNIDRFLTLLRRYADRAQFIVVTHQKRTMEAADCLYGVSMAGNGVSKVVSRRLERPAPAEQAAREDEQAATAAA